MPGVIPHPMSPWQPLLIPFCYRQWQKTDVLLNVVNYKLTFTWRLLLKIKIVKGFDDADSLSHSLCLRFQHWCRQHGVGQRNAGKSAAQCSEELTVPAAGSRQHSEGASCRDPQVTAAVHRWARVCRHLAAASGLNVYGMSAQWRTFQQTVRL